MKINILKWVVEFKLKNKKDNDRIAYLAKKLTDELIAQGYDLSQEVGSDKWPIRYDICQLPSYCDTNPCLIIEKVLNPPFLIKLDVKY